MSSEAVLTILFLLIAPVVIFLIIFLSIRHRRKKYGTERLTREERIGKSGEWSVHNVLMKYLKNHKGYLIDNVIVANLKGKTSQIDHILFTPYGIFVVETKNYAGYIYGKYTDQYWTQVMGYDTKNRLFNPVIQNRTHCSRIGGILGEKYGVISCVVFPRADITHISGCEGYVFTRRQFYKYLNKFDRVIYNDKKLEQMYNKINEYKIHPICTEQEHVSRIRNEL